MLDAEKFSSWWSDIAPELEKKVWYLVGEEAKDIVQDVSVMAVMRFEEFETFEDFRRWCFRRSHWLALDEIGRRKRFSKEDPSAVSTEMSEERKVLLDSLYRLIEALPPRQRNVTLDRLEGYSAGDIATRYSVKVSTVPSLWRHAKQKLMDSLEVNGNESKKSV